MNAEVSPASASSSAATRPPHLLSNTLRNFQDGMRAMIPVLEERQREADPKARPFIEAALARVRDLAGDLPAPVATTEDQREIDHLTPQQEDKTRNGI